MNGRVRSDAHRRYDFLAGLLTIAILASISLVGCGGGQSASGPQGGAPDRRAFEGETLTLVLKEGYEIEAIRSEEHTSELQSRQYLVCRLLLEKKKNKFNLIVYGNHPTHHD